MAILASIRDINSAQGWQSACSQSPRVTRKRADCVISDKKIRITVARVFNPNFLEVTVFLDCNTKKTYCQIGSHLQYYNREDLEEMSEPLPKEQDWDLWRLK